MSLQRSLFFFFFQRFMCEQKTFLEFFFLCVRILNNLFIYRAGQMITGMDLFKIFVVYDAHDLHNCLHKTLHWMKESISSVKFQVHPVSVLLLTRVYYLCASLHKFTYRETTTLIKRGHKVKTNFFFLMFLLFLFVWMV
jgi:hypothetical protein